VKRYAHQQVFSTGEWWDFEQNIDGTWRRVYMADLKYFNPPPTSVRGDLAVPPTEQEVVLRVFREMLRAATSDGGRKRAMGAKPPWWRDPTHEPAIFSHLCAWKHGVQKDHDSGAHPLVHLAWRALAIAYQETYGRVDPERARDLEEDM
jgi:hypothetical protein